jgi:hypothetical protein
MGQMYQYWWRRRREINVFPRYDCVLYPFVAYLLSVSRITPAPAWK